MRGLDAGAPGVDLRDRRLERLPRHGVLLDQRLVPRDVLLVAREVGLGLRQLALRLLHHGGELARIDRVEQVALLDLAALREVHGLQHALDARTNLDLGVAARDADPFHVDRHVTLDDVDDLDVGWWRAGRRRSFLTAGRERGSEGNRCGPERASMHWDPSTANRRLPERTAACTKRVANYPRADRYLVLKAWCSTDEQQRVCHSQDAGRRR